MPPYVLIRSCRIPGASIGYHRPHELPGTPLHQVKICKDSQGGLGHVRAGIPRDSHGSFFHTHYTEREDLMVLFDRGTPAYRNRVRRMWRNEPVQAVDNPSADSVESPLVFDEEGAIIVT